MFIELVDDLRCPRAHEETWLVAAADRTEDRDIVEGTLGCPICHAEYPIRDGAVWFTERALTRPPADARQRIDPELAMRLAALLDLSDAQGFALLAGSWGAAVALLRDIVPTHFVLLNPGLAVTPGRGSSVLHSPMGIPLASGTCRGVALDDAHSDPPHLDAAVRVLRPRGRLVAPASTPMPDGVSELARDGRLWVAERATPTKLVTLQTRASL